MSFIYPRRFNPCIHSTEKNAQPNSIYKSRLSILTAEIATSLIEDIDSADEIIKSFNSDGTSALKLIR